MVMDNKAWLTLYQTEFDRTSYLYHFTSVEKAILILDGDSLRFSKITSMNDTLEAKPKISLSRIVADEYLNEIFNCINQINKEYIQLLCFSQDTDSLLETNETEKYFSDYSGRGFALPRMWAQYAHDNDGVCFVFDKKIISRKIHEQLIGSLIKEDSIEYVSQYTNPDFDYKNLEFLLQSKSEITKSVNFANFLQENKAYTKYNYFCKLKDWSNENEYRFLAYGDKEFFIRNIKEALVGIIIGERIRPSDEKIIKFFCQDFYDIKKISFSYNGCLLQNIYDEEI